MAPQHAVSLAPQIKLFLHGKDGKGSIESFVEQMTGAVPPKGQRDGGPKRWRGRQRQGRGLTISLVPAVPSKNRRVHPKRWHAGTCKGLTISLMPCGGAPSSQTEENIKDFALLRKYYEPVEPGEDTCPFCCVSRLDTCPFCCASTALRGQATAPVLPRGPSTGVKRLKADHHDRKVQTPPRPPRPQSMLQIMDCIAPRRTVHVANVDCAALRRPKTSHGVLLFGRPPPPATLRTSRRTRTR